MVANSHQNGNAFLYVLIAVILFGALMFTLSRSQDSESPTSELDSGKMTVSVNEILGYAGSVMNAVTQMQAASVQNDQIDFTLPSDATFNNAPTIHKIFHPDGGGLNYKTLPTDVNADNGAGVDAGYYVGRFNSIEWTPSTTEDIVFVAYEITTEACEAINQKLRGSATVPVVIGDSLENLFIDDSLHGGANADFNIANCAACEEIPALCVQSAAGTNLFYSILEAE